MSASFFTHLTPQHIKSLLNDKAITLSHIVHEDAQGGMLARLDFKDEKFPIKIHRAFAKGKGVRVKHSDTHDIYLHHGDGLFDSISRGFQDLGNRIKDTAQDAGHKIVDVAHDVENKATPVVNPIINKAKPIGWKIGNQIKQQFQPDNIVNGLKTVTPDIAAGLVGAAATAAADGNPLAGVAAGTATKYAVKKALGQGIFGDTFRKIKNTARQAGDAIKSGTMTAVKNHKQIIKTVAPVAARFAGKAIGKAAGAAMDNEMVGDVIGDIAEAGIRKGVEAYTGRGVELPKRRGRPRKTDNIIVKRKGGSFGPLGGSVKGGSFKPLGGAIVSQTSIGAKVSNAKLGGALEAQKYTGITASPDVPSNPTSSAIMHERMARLRELKALKKRGGDKLDS